MHGNSKNRNNTTKPQHQYNVVHPQCRGYVHKLRLFLFPQNHSFSAHTAADFFLTKIAAHTAAGFCAHSCRSFFPPYKIPLRTQLQRSSTHTAGTCPFLTKSDLTCLIFSYIKKPNLSILHKRLFILRGFTKPWS